MNRLSRSSSVLILALLLSSLPFSMISQADHLIQFYDGMIQPGADILSAEGGTLGWIFESRTRTYADGEPVLYASSHGHGSAREEGEKVWLQNQILVGTVVLKEYGPTQGGKDWILIKIPEKSRQFVDFSVLYWTGPTGMPDPSAIELNDVVCHYGWGNGYAWQEDARPRCGSLSAAYYSSDGSTGRVESFPMTTSGGDSGSPIFHYETGQALGIVKGGRGYSTNAVDICSMVNSFKDSGFDVKLATAEYDPPEPKPVVPRPLVNYTGALSTECLGGA